MAGGVSRRSFLGGTGALALLGLLPAPRVDALLAETAGAGAGGRFLDAGELAALRAVTARLLPGPPTDPGPGAVEARAAEAIDLLLGAFEVDPPLIHAGGPFSRRAGGTRDDFARFVGLDRQAELGWRIRLEGSRGRREREFAGPVVGLQEIYRAGLARLERLARAHDAARFAAADPVLQDRLLADPRDRVVGRFVDAALANTLEAVLGPPEYGGNQGRVGWRRLGWEGDRQPRGFSRSEVSGAGVAVARSRPGDHDDPAAEEALRRLAPVLAGRRASTERWWGAHRRPGGR